MEPPILRSIPAFGVASSFSGATASLRRSYMCYNCNYPFHISPTAVAIADASSAFPSSFRCPRCHLRHLISHHTISASPPPPVRPTRRRNDDPPAIVSSTTSTAPSTQQCSICLEDFDISSDAASVSEMGISDRARCGWRYLDERRMSYLVNVKAVLCKYFGAFLLEACHHGRGQRLLYRVYLFS
ncbi:RING-type E3 ubiquitin transferase [Salvia divinorum]|uniref:RING-type E3 ubiquitin transferase n=1 Tax=Salvia divinorum TaxID=28513 RepID=A0ABD1I8X3_SALDI